MTAGTCEFSMTMIKDYSLVSHRQRFSAWAASTAARSSPKCRFSVAQGFTLLCQSGFTANASSWDQIPNAEDFDAWHRRRCGELICSATDVIGDGDRKEFTHGVAAKLINTYLKSMFIAPSAPADEKKMMAIHPPIDRLLLTHLAQKNVGDRQHLWRKFAAIGWSSFNSADYQAVIDEIRSVTDGELWRIEIYWRGYQ